LKFFKTSEYLIFYPIIQQKITYDRRMRCNPKWGLIGLLPQWTSSLYSSCAAFDFKPSVDHHLNPFFPPFHASTLKYKQIHCQKSFYPLPTNTFLHLPLLLIIKITYTSNFKFSGSYFHQTLTPKKTIKAMEFKRSPVSEKLEISH